MKKIILFLLFYSVCFSGENFGFLYKQWKEKGKRSPFEKVITEGEEKVIKPIIVEEPPNFNITGIVYSKEKSYILVNERIIKNGDEIDGFILKEIYPEYVIFKKNGKYYRMGIGGNNYEE